MCTTEKERTTDECGCSGAESAGPRPSRLPVAVPTSSPRLEDLIPIAVVITAGCETCAQKMVARALKRGSSERHIRKTLGIVASMREQECLAQAVGRDVLERMEKPLSAGRNALSQAVRPKEAAR